MTARPARTSKSQAIASEVRRRIVEREWRQGDRIPDEADLAVEFGAARATVNKALQVLAGEGILERKRRAGTHVTVNPARRAMLTIPIVREEIECAGLSYSYRVIALRRGPLPEEAARRLEMAAGHVLLHLRAVHYADARPYQYEDRWLNPQAIPDMDKVDFRLVNANEWLVRNAPYTRADISFSAENASPRDARFLQTEPRQALLVQYRTTWNGSNPITSVRAACHPGYRIHAES